MKDKIKTESVRIDADVLKRVRSYVKDKRTNLGGFISMQLGAIMNRLDKRKILP
jgi:DNA-dependent RNA polymerase auxiliary subunit epsilon